MAHSNDYLSQKIQDGEFKLIKMGEDHNLLPFDCGIDDLNEFLNKDSKIHLKYLCSTTYLIESKDRTVAYYTLLNDLLNISPTYNKDFKSEIKRLTKEHFNFYIEMLRVNLYPAAKIGRFAVDNEYQGKGIGSSLLKSILISFLFHNKTGCQFLTVDALNNKDTLRFYEKNNFKYVPFHDISAPSLPMYFNLVEYKNTIAY